MADTNIDYIVIGSEIKATDGEGMVDICTRIRKKDVPDEVLLGIKVVQEQMARKMEMTLKESTLVTEKSTSKSDE